MREYTTRIYPRSLASFLRHKPSLLFIPTVSGEPKPISDRLFRSICLGDEGGLVREGKKTSTVCAKV